MRAQTNANEFQGPTHFITQEYAVNSSESRNRYSDTVLSTSIKREGGKSSPHVEKKPCGEIDYISFSRVIWREWNKTTVLMSFQFKCFLRIMKIAGQPLVSLRCLNDVCIGCASPKTRSQGGACTTLRAYLVSTTKYRPQPAHRVTESPQGLLAFVAKQFERPHIVKEYNKGFYHESQVYTDMSFQLSAYVNYLYNSHVTLSALLLAGAHSAQLICCTVLPIEAWVLIYCAHCKQRLFKFLSEGKSSKSVQKEREKKSVPNHKERTSGSGLYTTNKQRPRPIRQAWKKKVAPSFIHTEQLTVHQHRESVTEGGSNKNM